MKLSGFRKNDYSSRMHNQGYRSRANLHGHNPICQCQMAKSGKGLASNVASSLMKEVYSNYKKPKRSTEKNALKWLNEKGRKK